MEGKLDKRIMAVISFRYMRALSHLCFLLMMDGICGCAFKQKKTLNNGKKILLFMTIDTETPTRKRMFLQYDSIPSFLSVLLCHQKFMSRIILSLAKNFSIQLSCL